MGARAVMDELMAFRARVEELAVTKPFTAYAMVQMAGDYPSLHDPEDERQAAQDARVLAFLARVKAWEDDGRPTDNLRAGDRDRSAGAAHWR